MRVHTQWPAPHQRPKRARPPTVARRPGRKGGAYRVHRGDTRGVPRANVRVEGSRLAERLPAEPSYVRRRRNALACVGADARASNRTRKHAGRAPTQHRVRGGPTSTHPFTHPDFASIHIHNVCYVCVGYMSRRRNPRTHVMATAASSARAIARTCAFEAVQPHVPYPSLTQAHICLNIYVQSVLRHVYTYT
jgi:hypothetical protein